jgi:uncharacterized protein (DUF3820 family)
MVKREGSEEAALEAMCKTSAEPILFSTIRFGKYKGKKLAELAKEDPGYLEWLLSAKRQNPEGEEDWIYTLEHYLKS